ncbi:MAG: PQQ-dependent sugar dehydrogenase [Gemmatimonadota bacterium]|nr:PQQ-dependent sugar dehydrogenase [Gemmatimonadota bacterium]
MKFLLNPLILWAALVLAACSSIENDSATIIRTAFHDFSVDTVTGGLVHPFSMVFTPEGDLLVTERPGRLRIIRDDVLIDDPVEGLPEILAIGQGAMPQDGREQAGMRDLILHPDFAENRLLYLSYTKPGPDSLGNIAVVRGRFENDRLSDVEELFHADAFGNGSNRSSQWGGRLALDGKGYLFITIGDRQWPSEGDLAAHPSQNLASHNGTTIRLHEDGRVPEDNPFVGQDGVHPEIWTYGHRNAQGLALHPETGDVWLNEHGPQGGDELNLVRPGLNYGWPVVGFGVNYRTGIAIHSATHQDSMEPPVHIWVPSIGVTGMLFYTGAAFPDWRGDMIVASLRGEQLVRLTLDGQQVAREETLMNGMGRIRDVRQGPEGIIYLAMDGDARGFDGDPTPIVRLIPTRVR